MMAFVAANATSVLKAPEAVAFAATKPRGVYNVKVFGKGVDSTVSSHIVSAGPRNPIRRKSLWGETRAPGQTTLNGWWCRIIRV